MPVLPSVAVSVLCVICGETWHPDLADRGQDNSCQQHSLHYTLQAPAEWPRTGSWWPGNLNAFPCHREGMKVSLNSVYHLWLNELRILTNVKMWNTAMQIQYIFSMFQTRQGQFIIHHNTWPCPQLLALTQSFISQCYFLAYGPASCLSCLPAQVPEASNIHFIPHAHCKRSVSTPAHIPRDVASRFPSDHVPNLPPAPSLPLPFSPCGNGTS